MFNKKEAETLKVALAKAKYTYNVSSDYADGDHIEDGGMTVNEVGEMMLMALAMYQLEMDQGTPFNEMAVPTRIVITLNRTNKEGSDDARTERTPTRGG
jgi:hypothetical protein